MKFCSADFLKGSYSLEGYKVVKDGVAIGILKPSTLFGETLDSSDEFLVWGTDDTIKFEGVNPDSFWAGIIRSGSILYGSDSEVELVAKLLGQCRSSRTYSYLALIADDCSDLLKISRLLSNATVTCLGCGGIGSLSAVTIAGIGVKKLKLIDFDRIEKSNLNRQLLFNTNDIGKFKTDVLRSRILERFEDVEVDSIKTNGSNTESIKDHILDSDVVLMTADEPVNLIYEILDIASNHDIKLISAGYIFDKLRASYFYRSEPIVPKVQWERGPSFIAPSYGPSNVELAGIASSMVALAIINKIQDDVAYFTDTWKSTTYPRTSQTK